MGGWWDWRMGMRIGIGGSEVVLLRKLFFCWSLFDAVGWKGFRDVGSTCKCNESTDVSHAFSNPTYAAGLHIWGAPVADVSCSLLQDKDWVLHASCLAGVTAP